MRAYAAEPLDLASGLRDGAIAIPLWPLAWTVVLVGALWLRLGAIDAIPLAPDEAARALDGLAILRGEGGEYRSAPLVPNLLALWMLLFSPADGPVRVPSALAGWALCLTPLLFRARIGPVAALASGALLALSPLEVLASRSAHPAVFATLAAAGLVGCLIAACARQDGRWLLGAGAAVGLGLGTGQAFVGQLMAIVLALAIWPPFGRPEGFDVRGWAARAVGVGLGCALVVDTLLFTRLGGVKAGLVQPIVDWLGSVGLGFPALQAGALLGMHELGLLALALYGVIRAPERRLAGFLGVWSLTSIGLALLGRSPDLTSFVVPTVPLALLGGIGLTRVGWAGRARRPAVWLTALTLLIPLVFLVLAVNAAVNRGGTVSLAPLAIAAGGLVAAALVAGAWLDRVELAAAAGLALAVVLGVIWLTAEARLNFGGPERAGPALLGQSSRPELVEVREMVRDWWRQDPHAVVRVDQSLRPVLEWSLRDGPPIEWISVAPTTAERVILGGLTAANRPGGEWLRLTVAERYRAPAEAVGPQALWRWFVQRQSLVGVEPHAILVPQ